MFAIFFSLLLWNALVKCDLNHANIQDAAFILSEAIELIDPAYDKNLDELYDFAVSRGPLLLKFLQFDSEAAAYLLEDKLRLSSEVPALSEMIYTFPQIFDEFEYEDATREIIESAPRSTVMAHIATLRALAFLLVEKFSSKYLDLSSLSEDTAAFISCYMDSIGFAVKRSIFSAFIKSKDSDWRNVLSLAGPAFLKTMQLMNAPLDYTQRLDTWELDRMIKRDFHLKHVGKFYHQIHSDLSHGCFKDEQRNRIDCVIRPHMKEMLEAESHLELSNDSDLIRLFKKTVASLQDSFNDRNYHRNMAQTLDSIGTVMQIAKIEEQFPSESFNLTPKVMSFEFDAELTSLNQVLFQSDHGEFELKAIQKFCHSLSLNWMQEAVQSGFFIPFKNLTSVFIEFDDEIQSTILPLNNLAKLPENLKNFPLIAFEMILQKYDRVQERIGSYSEAFEQMIQSNFQSLDKYGSVIEMIYAAYEIIDQFAFLENAPILIEFWTAKRVLDFAIHKARNSADDFFESLKELHYQVFPYFHDAEDVFMSCKLNGNFDHFSLFLAQILSQ